MCSIPTRMSPGSNARMTPVYSLIPVVLPALNLGMCLLLFHGNLRRRCDLVADPIRHKVDTEHHLVCFAGVGQAQLCQVLAIAAQKLFVHRKAELICHKSPSFSDAISRRCLSREVAFQRSEEHTSELQSPDHLVCRLLLEKKK